MMIYVHAVFLYIYIYMEKASLGLSFLDAFFGVTGLALRLCTASVSWSMRNGRRWSWLVDGAATAMG